jgi:hypothetical protein
MSLRLDDPRPPARRRSLSPCGPRRPVRRRSLSPCDLCWRASPVAAPPAGARSWYWCVNLPASAPTNGTCADPSGVDRTERRAKTTGGAPAGTGLGFDKGDGPGLGSPGPPASITRRRTSHPRRTPRSGRFRVGGRDQFPLTNERVMRVVSRGTLVVPVGMPRRPERR